LVTILAMQWATFSQIRGHRVQAEALMRLCASGRHGHAYLFEGPAGVGKRQVASAFLARLACRGEATARGDACGVCPSCAALQRGTHPDLTTIARDGSFIKIDQVREALKWLRFDPVQGRIKGILIEGADTLNEAAANALLKTLEEPPSATVFVLVTARPQTLLETIRSRCQVLRFAELPAGDVAALLTAAGVGAVQAAQIAPLSGGSVAQGLTLADPQRFAIIDAIARFAVGLGDQPPGQGAVLSETLFTQIPEADEGDKSTPAERERQFLLFAIDVLRSVLRDAMWTGCGLDPAALAHAAHAGGLQALAGRAAPERLAAAIATCQELEQRLVFNPNPKLAWANLLVTLGQQLR
jgi:DNA polymerase-3 subunit delta'